MPARLFSARFRTLSALLIGAALGLTITASFADAADPGKKGDPPSTASAGSARTITWAELLPKGWDPYASLRKLDLSRLQDGDPRAMEAMATLRTEWDKAPIAQDIVGQTVRLPGYLIPLDRDQDSVKSFLLVPYFGACIHSPPPPSNQIIDVRAATPYKGGRMMDAVWISGRIEAVRSDSPFGAVSYRMTATRVEAYVPSTTK